MEDNYVPYGDEWCKEMMRHSKPNLISLLKRAYQKMKHYNPDDDGWIEYKEGQPLPDYDEYVLWCAEDGNCFVEALDKDGNAWLEGLGHAKITHWKPITLPKIYNQ